MTLPESRSMSTQGHHLYKLNSPMLHAKFQYRRTSGSGEDGFYYERVWRLSLSCDLATFINVDFPFPRRLQIKFCFDWPSGLREDLRKWWTDRRRLDWHTISSPCEPNGLFEQINLMFMINKSGMLQIILLESQLLIFRGKLSFWLLICNFNYNIIALCVIFPI